MNFQWLKVFPLQELKDDPEFSPLKIREMPTERCAQLMVVGMANNLDEIWISENPGLLITYTNQYFPNFQKWLVSPYKFALCNFKNIPGHFLGMSLLHEVELDLHKF